MLHVSRENHYIRKLKLFGLLQILEWLSWWELNLTTKYLQDYHSEITIVLISKAPGMLKTTDEEIFINKKTNRLIRKKLEMIQGLVQES